MAVYDLEEQERIAALKDWWDKWGRLVYLVVGAAVTAFVAVQGYRYHERTQTDEAYTLFKSVQQTAQEANVSKEFKKLSEAATALADKYPGTFYATDVQLMAAKAAFDGNDLALAKTHLQWVIDNGRSTYVNIARLRLASVLLDQKLYDEALLTLEKINDDGFASIAADLRGDVFSAQGRRDEARAAYQVAVDKAETRSPTKAISQAKLDANGGSVEKSAGKSEPASGVQK